MEVLGVDRDQEGPDGRELRCDRRLPYPVERVWRALTETGQVDTWFPQRIMGEWRVGSPLRFEDPTGKLPAVDGEVIRCEPPSRLEFRWGTDVVRFELVPEGQGCHITLVDTASDARRVLGSDARPPMQSPMTVITSLGFLTDALRWATRRSIDRVAGQLGRFVTLPAAL